MLSKVLKTGIDVALITPAGARCKRCSVPFLCSDAARVHPAWVPFSVLHMLCQRITPRCHALMLLVRTRDHTSSVMTSFDSLRRRPEGHHGIFSR